MNTSVAPTPHSHAATRAASLLAVPKAAPADSFVLHAPLELMARVGLLSHVAIARREEAIGMIDWLADQYDAAGAPVPEPPTMPFGTPLDGARRLLDALHDGDLDMVDAVAAAVLPALSPPETVGLLGESVVTSLAAAGHAPIGLALLARVQPALPTTLLRGALRGIASRPEWAVRWHEGGQGQGDPGGRLYDAIRSTPQLGRPGSDFIHPLMSQVQDSGVAASLLGPVLADRFDIADASRTLTRIAAWSMVHDDPAQAPYGWTHALTMPQAVMSLAGAGVRPRTALAVAGTFTIGFRAAHGLVPLPAAIVPGNAPDAGVEELATAAALHQDAHLVKFTLACLHAAVDDPAFRPLYLRAIDHLVRWWGA